ncbi:MAG: hypothetical protein WAP52_02885 [Candidatus Sungiibacteriota bacterium]
MNEIPIRTKKILIAGVFGFVLLIVVGLGYYRYAIRAPDQGSPIDTSAGNTAGSASSAPVSVGIKGTGDYTVEAVPLSAGNAPAGMPQLRRPVVFSSAFPPEAQRLMTQKIDASIGALEKDSRLFDEWMQLAMLRKTVDDYEGARQIWEFLKTTNPKQASPYANLAALYTYELKNPTLAEQNFAQAMQKGPKDISVYRNAYDFYRYVRKDDAKAKQTLQDGIKETQSPDLQYLLDHYGEL